MLGACPPLLYLLQPSRITIYYPGSLPRSQYVWIRILTRNYAAGHAPFLPCVCWPHRSPLSGYLGLATPRRPGRRKQSVLTRRYPETSQTLREHLDFSTQGTHYGAIADSERGIDGQGIATDPKMRTTGKNVSPETTDKGGTSRTFDKDVRIATGIEPKGESNAIPDADGVPWVRRRGSDARGDGGVS